jgi:hypothetical protein
MAGYGAKRTEGLFLLNKQIEALLPKSFVVLFSSSVVGSALF